jgi:starch synthase (maltosyl-transferring)
MNTHINSVIIEHVYPELDGGRFPIKRTVGDMLEVEADIYSHGHDVVRGVLQVRKKGTEAWSEVELTLVDNDRWKASFVLAEVGTYEYTILAWRDFFFSWAADLLKKYNANPAEDITSDLLEGKRLVEVAGSNASKEDKTKLAEFITFFERQLTPGKAVDNIRVLVDEIETKVKKNQPVDKQLSSIRDLLEAVNFERKLMSPTDDPVKEIILGEELKTLMKKYSDRSDCGKYEKVLGVKVQRKEAEYSAWYEMWHRSQGTMIGQSATFDDMIERLPEIGEMGFNVIYLPPIHPIGITSRKGPNNSLKCPPGSPGCPWAIGNKEGGHTAINPELGTIEGFRKFVKECRKMKMEVALDLALQTSPDHPWVTEHPDWFYSRPDGTIKFAENPPKKYEDIYPINFNTKDREGLWNEVLSVVRFWIAEGVRIFRVDNPHTKPVYFWEWLIDQVHATDPDVIFLSEAFTKPKMMMMLAKAGFTQSYTYFTWRNFKHELADYLTELTKTEMAEYYIGNLWTNTPDILPVVLQNAPRSAFMMRATLACTLSSTWGIYNGFELCEGTPKPGTEEYLNSEKYQYKVWDWERPGNIKDYIEALNRIRSKQPALQSYKNLEFYKAENDNILFYGKFTKDRNNIILVIVNLDPYKKQESFVYVPIDQLGIKPDETYQVYDLLEDERFYWKGEKNFISLDPQDKVAHIFLVYKWSHKEQNFDYFY